MVRILPGAPLLEILMLIVSDLDGTLLERGSFISDRNKKSFEQARNLGAICAIATGKSLQSAQKDLSPNFPIDYLIFSSGAGILDWNQKKLIHQSSLTEPQIKKVFNYLWKDRLDFTIQLEAPHTHQFLFSGPNLLNVDFTRRMEINKEHGSLINPDSLPQQASEFIVIQSHPSSLSLLEQIQHDLSDELNVVRATSPTDGKSLWIEIMNLTTSKAIAAEWLRNKHQIEKSMTYALGNDFNDLQLLNWASKPLVVADAAFDLLKNYKCVSNHTDHALEKAMEVWRLSGHGK